MMKVFRVRVRSSGRVQLAARWDDEPGEWWALHDGGRVRMPERTVGVSGPFKDDDPRFEMMAEGELSGSVPRASRP